MSKIKTKLKKYLPPVFVSWGKFFLNYGYFGSYSTWADAKNESGEGYNAEIILNKVKDSLLKVKSGHSVYERDSVLFDKVEYVWSLLSILLWVTSKQGNRLKILDFGGSLGSTYFQNRFFLQHLKELEWSIVEQDNFVRCGKKYFEDDKLKFYFDLEDYLINNNSEAVLISSVLQYLENPYQLLEKIIDNKFKYIIIDRTPFLFDDYPDKVVVQKVSPKIYDACYPCWIFNKNKLINFFSEKYNFIT